MKPVELLPKEILARIDFLLTDIDDTVTFEGRLPATSLAAMERLEQEGVELIPITGRPAGWCDHIARMWPVRAVVGENGAFYFSYDRVRSKMNQVFVKTREERSRDRQRLNALLDQILEAVPEAQVASDQPYRIADLAIDYREDIPPLPQEKIDIIVRIFKKNGANVKVSSIHINGWFGDYDKLSMTEMCLRDVVNVDSKAHNDRFVFLGDSPNDAPMFAHFKNSVGVANVADFNLPTQPNWITDARGGRGFCEFVEILLKARR